MFSRIAPVDSTQPCSDRCKRPELRIPRVVGQRQMPAHVRRCKDGIRLIAVCTPPSSDIGIPALRILRPPSRFVQPPHPVAQKPRRAVERKACGLHDMPLAQQRT